MVGKSFAPSMRVIAAAAQKGQTLFMMFANHPGR